MLLAFDCGNTNTVFSIWDGEKWLCSLRTSTHHSRTADAYFTWFTTLIKHYKIEADINEGFDEILKSYLIKRGKMR